MRKQIVCGLLIASTLVFVGCQKNNSDKNTVDADANVSTTQESEADVTEEKATDDDADAAKEDHQEIDSAYSKPVTYDMKYLKQSNGKSVYSLTDKDIIAEYDKLYADAFKDVEDTLNDYIKDFDDPSMFENQSFNTNMKATTDNLVFNNSNDNLLVQTGSSFEMDCEFNLKNVGYTYVDLNSDGVFELIFGILPSVDEGIDYVSYENYENVFEKAYALVDGKVRKICDGGIRDQFWLGSDGWIYNCGSSGAANTGTWKLHFDINATDVEEYDGLYLGYFILDEFIGYWSVNGEDDEPLLYINEPIVKYMDEMAKESKFQVSEDKKDEVYAIEEEWENSKVEIDWLKMSDYLSKK